MAGKHLFVGGGGTSGKYVFTGNANVVGPASSTDNSVVRFDGTTGKLIQDSGASVDDSGGLTATGVNAPIANFSGTTNTDVVVTVQGAASQSAPLSQWQDNTPTFFAQMNNISAAQGGNVGNLRLPWNRALGNLYLGEWELGENGLTYCWDPSVSSVAYTAIPVFRILRPDFLTSGVINFQIDGSGNLVVASITAPQYVTSDNGYVEVAMGFFGATPGIYVHDTNGTPTDYLRFVKNNGTYIAQTTFDGQTTFGAYLTSAVALIARGYDSSTADILQIQQWGGVSGASGPVVAKFDYQGNLTIPKLNVVTGSNANAGTGTLSGGTATIATTAVTANSLIFLQSTGSSLVNVGTPKVTSQTAGTGFVVGSTNVLDTSTFNWLIVN